MTSALRQRNCYILGCTESTVPFIKSMFNCAGGGKLTGISLTLPKKERMGCGKQSWWWDLSPASCWAQLTTQYLGNHKIKPKRKLLSQFTRPLDCFIKPFQWGFPRLPTSDVQPMHSSLLLWLNLVPTNHWQGQISSKILGGFCLCNSPWQWQHNGGFRNPAGNRDHLPCDGPAKLARRWAARANCCHKKLV